jgi:flagella basal body P-ring formation protein FlgA
MRASTLPLLVCLLMWSLPAEPATLRSATTLQQPQVRISDLFDDAGPEAERVLGPGPSPGGRIVVEAAQAAAIARQFGVAWRPASPADRVVIDRPGRPLAREEVLGVLRSALLGAGAPDVGDIELPNFTPPLVPVEGAPQSAIEQVNYQATSGHFTATLAISVAGEPVQRIRVSGDMVEMTDLVVPTHRLTVGTVLQPEDLQTLRVRVGQSHGDVLRVADQAVGMAMRRLAVAGQPIPLADLGHPLVVQKGARVMMSLEQPGLSLSAVGVASESGGIGDRIAVLNPVSGALVDAEVTAAGQVRVSPNSAPRLPARAGNTQVSMR